MYKVIVSGRPIPAVRMTQRSKYQSKQAGKYLAYKNEIGWAAKAAQVQPIKTSVEVTATLYLHGGREGDVDNYAKALLDGLNGIAWHDDIQVRRLTVEKRKVESRDQERAEVEIRELEAA